MSGVITFSVFPQLGEVIHNEESNALLKVTKRYDHIYLMVRDERSLTDMGIVEAISGIGLYLDDIKALKAILEEAEKFLGENENVS